MKKPYELHIYIETDDLRDFEEQFIDAIEKAISESDNKVQVADKFICAIVDLTKVAINNNEFNKIADFYKEHMLASSERTRLNFYDSYTIAFSDIADDILRVACEVYDLQEKPKEKGNVNLKKEKKERD